MIEGDPVDPIVRAAADQLHATAIDELKNNKTFALIVPMEIEGEDGLALMFSGRMSLMLDMHMLLGNKLAIQAAKQFVAQHDEETSERDFVNEYQNLNFEKKRGGEGDATG